jgi:hypothetical protein
MSSVGNSLACRLLKHFALGEGEESMAQMNASAWRGYETTSQPPTKIVPGSADGFNGHCLFSLAQVEVAFADMTEFSRGGGWF